MRSIESIGPSRAVFCILNCCMWILITACSTRAVPAVTLDVPTDQSPHNASLDLDAAGAFIIEGSARNFWCGVASGGEIWCGGRNDFAQTGSGSRSEEAAPAPVADLGTGTDVSVGLDAACALDMVGHVWCWGCLRGSIRRWDDVACWLRPTRIEMPPATDVEVAVSHACALGGDGRVRCWGWGGTAVLRHLPAGTFQREAKLLQGFPSLASIDGSNEHLCGVSASDRRDLWCVAGDVGGMVPEEPARRVHGQVADFCASWGHGCFVSAVNGRVHCWGVGSLGAIGRDPNQFLSGSSSGTSVGVESQDLGGVEGIPPVVELSCGTSHTCARTLDGDVYCWGARAGCSDVYGGARCWSPRREAREAAELFSIKDTVCTQGRSGSVDCSTGSWSPQMTLLYPDLVGTLSQ